MQARLAVAAATSVEADVLLMDEWIAVGATPTSRRSPTSGCCKLVERAGILVLASHDVELLGLYCNKVKAAGVAASPRRSSHDHRSLDAASLAA